MVMAGIIPIGVMPVIFIMKVKIETETNGKVDRARLENSMMSALVAIGDYVVTHARRNAPKKSGNLADNISAEIPRVDGGGVFSISIGTGDVPYAMAIEFGSGIHKPGGGEKYPILPVRAKALAFVWKNHPPGMEPAADGKFYFKKVMHPGVRAQPYLRPALARVKKSAKAYVMGAVFEVTRIEE